MSIQIRKTILLLTLLFCTVNSFLLAQSKEQIHEIVDSLNTQFTDLHQVDITKAEELNSEALRLAIEAKYSFGEANARTNLSVLEYRKGNYTKAIEQCFEAIKIYEKEERFKNTSNYGLVFLRLASALHTAKDYSRSKTYSHNAVAIAQRIKDRKLLALAYEELGNNYNSLQQFDSTLYYYKNAKNTYLELGLLKNIADIENNTGIVYFFKGDFKEAIAHYSEALVLNQKNGKHFSAINSLYNIAEAYYMLKSYNQTLHYADSSQSYAQKFNAFGNLIDIYLLKAKTYQAINKLDSSASYYERTIALKDSVYSDSYKKELATLQTQSDIYKKETENKLLTKDKRIVELYRNFAIAGIIGLVILLGFILLNQRLRIQRRVKDKLEEEVALRTKEISRQKEIIFHTNLRLKLALNGTKFDSHLAVNMLTVIQQAAVKKTPQEVQSYLEKLAHLMQYVLEKSPLERVPIDEELRALELYIQLEQLRLDHCFDYSIEVQTGNQHTIPALLLQPYVEHAILHGITPASGDALHLSIHVKPTVDILTIIITDNGVDRRNEKRDKHNPVNSKIGRERLDLLTHLTHKNHLVSLENEVNSNGDSIGTKLVLQIPVESTPLIAEKELVNETFDSAN